MPFNSSIRLFLTSSSHSSRPKRTAGAKLVAAVMEVLERRRLLSATASVASNLLTINDDTSNDTLVVQPDGLGNDQVVVNSSVIGTFAATSFNSISITNAGGTTDVITIDNGITDPATITGGSGIDSITGGGGNDSIVGNDGNDTIRGGDGNDTIDGGNGNDTLDGGKGADSVLGGAGNDTLRDDSATDNGPPGGNDTLAGGSGNDTYVFAGSGALGSDFIQEDPVVPGPDSSVDTLDFSAISNSTDQHGATVDISSTSVQSSVVSGQLGLQCSSDTGIENVAGSPWTDTFTGNSRNNSLTGAAGNMDMLYGGDGNDTLDGGAGDGDCVHGQGGNDLEYGGTGDGDVGTSIDGTTYTDPRQ